MDYDVITVNSSVGLKDDFHDEREEVRIVNPESGAKSMDVLDDEFDISPGTIDVRPG